MSQPPPYSLRPNKAVDRLVFVDVIRRLDKIGDLSEYMYYSLGGPFLEDFRILSEVYPAIRMISIDSDPEIIKRQRFNLPCSHLKLKRSDLSAFIAQYESRDRKSIVWLDYTRLAYADLDDFRSLLTKVATNSLVKITLRAKSADYLTDQAKREQFKQEFALLLEDPTADPPASKKDFAKLIQQMVRIASQRAFPGVNPLVYQPLSSFYYEDSTPMFTLTGIVCRRVDRLQVRQAFQDLPFANLYWAGPTRIAAPVLTTKERLHLQRSLPVRRDPGRALRRALGFRIDSDRTENHELMKQYAQFHRYSPYYLRGIP